MLPILGGTNRGPNWAARIAKLQTDLRELIKDENRKSISEQNFEQMFVKSESALTDLRPSEDALVASLRALKKHAGKPESNLSVEFLFELQNALQVEIGLRRESTEPQVPGHAPARPQALSMVLDSTLEWFSAESFLELHPIEQAGLVHSRFIDVQFFPSENTRLARLAADFYLIKADLPALIIAAGRNLYKAAIHKAILMDTQPLVSLFAESTEMAITWLIEKIQEE